MHATVQATTDPGLEGLEGLVIDETRNTLLVRTASGERRVAKDTCTWTITDPKGNGATVPGDQLRGRPDERIKRKVRQ